MMYEGVRGALAADDVIKAQGEETRFRVPRDPRLETARRRPRAEMIKRGMFSNHRLDGRSGAPALRNEGLGDHREQFRPAASLI